VEREQRKLAAILAADVVGYSRLMGRDESRTLARLREHRKQRFEPILARHGGRLVKLTGDGALAEFPSAVDALVLKDQWRQRRHAATPPDESRRRIHCNPSPARGIDGLPEPWRRSPRSGSTGVPRCERKPERGVGDDHATVAKDQLRSIITKPTRVLWRSHQSFVAEIAGRDPTEQSSEP
jgi:class 3 adenylate cyclase